ncbi:hypothetical protein D8674_035303 [Pyrus ussuriensis x Pyrus communis]|uniref:Uncharacterized protein n=1 Tax=Pyrus ussuriensis x Pyrus communis TaxID=2448454 RepID=A0A5N5GCT5_9ROSA|nr:hypothetical protein D8674_035303 [Pyrus ussuriensis x Pyrus communis]
MGNNCPITKWRSWKDVLGNVKKAVMDELVCKYVFDDELKEQLMKIYVLSKSKIVVRLERYRRKQVPYFEGKNLAEAYAEFKYDIGNLVWRDCSADFEFWKKVLEELKKSMLGELSIHWDVDESDEKQRIYVDGLFKQSFR